MLYSVFDELYGKLYGILFLRGRGKVDVVFDEVYGIRFANKGLV